MRPAPEVASRAEAPEARPRLVVTLGLAALVIVVTLVLVEVVTSRSGLDTGALTVLVGLAFVGWAALVRRSEERRVGKECRSRWSPYH